MITTCTQCQVSYQLDDDKVPHRVIRVRCPECQGVFNLDGRQAQAEAPESVQAPVAPEPRVTMPAEPAPAPEPVAVTQAAPEIEPEPEPEPELDEELSSASVPSAAEERQKGGVAVVEKSATTTRRRRPKEQMLARALVSDILVYNRKARDAALAKGNLHEALGGEIKKCWELYKEKVTAEVANNTNYFREALNEILAEGEEVF